MQPLRHKKNEGKKGAKGMNGLEFINFIFKAAAVIVFAIIGLTAWCLRDRAGGGWR